MSDREALDRALALLEATAERLDGLKAAALTNNLYGLAAVAEAEEELRADIARLRDEIAAG